MCLHFLSHIDKKRRRIEAGKRYKRTNINMTGNKYIQAQKRQTTQTTLIVKEIDTILDSL